MTKIVRMYLHTYVDVEMESENFKDDEEMADWVTINATDYIEDQQVYDNMTLEDWEVIDEEDL